MYLFVLHFSYKHKCIGASQKFRGRSHILKPAAPRSPWMQLPLKYSFSSYTPLQYLCSFLKHIWKPPYAVLQHNLWSCLNSCWIFWMPSSWPVFYTWKEVKDTVQNWKGMVSCIYTNRGWYSRGFSCRSTQTLATHFLRCFRHILDISLLTASSSGIHANSCCTIFGFKWSCKT